jgi:hypothetical protein
VSADKPGADGELASFGFGREERFRRSPDHLNHPLAEALVAGANGRELSPAEIRFDDAKDPGKVSGVEPLIGRCGWLTLCAFSVESLE